MRLTCDGRSSHNIYKTSGVNLIQSINFINVFAIQLTYLIDNFFL